MGSFAKNAREEKLAAQARKHKTPEEQIYNLQGEGRDRETGRPQAARDTVPAECSGSARPG